MNVNSILENPPNLTVFNQNKDSYVQLFLLFLFIMRNKNAIIYRDSVNAAFVTYKTTNMANHMLWTFGACVVCCFSTITYFSNVLRWQSGTCDI